MKKDGYECEGNCSHSATYPYQVEHDLQSPLLPVGSLIKYRSFTATARHFLLFMFFEFVVKSKDIPQLLFSFLSISFLLENLLKLRREIHLRSLVGAKGGLNYSYYTRFKAHQFIKVISYSCFPLYSITITHKWVLYLNC